MGEIIVNKYEVDNDTVERDLFEFYVQLDNFGLLKNGVVKNGFVKDV